MTPIELLKSKVQQQLFPSEFPEFGGANLIISKDPLRNHYPHDVFVCTEYASELSWLVEELKGIYNSDIDYMNKYQFYPIIGESIKIALGEGKSLLDVMLQVVNEIELQWVEKTSQG